MLSHSPPVPLARSYCLPTDATATTSYLPDEMIFLARSLYDAGAEERLIATLRAVDDDVDAAPLLRFLQDYPMPEAPIALIEHWRRLRECSEHGVGQSTALFSFQLALATGLRIGAEHFAQRTGGAA